MRVPDGAELVARYRANYGLTEAIPVTEEMVLEHWRLERRLTEELLSSTPETRAETFERCYSELYRAVPWLREGGDHVTGSDAAEHALWRVLIGDPPRDVYEVGSGDGSLVRNLAALGYRCRATEITSERGDRTELPGLSWGRTDGVHLDEYERPGSFDAVISNQVLEHLHPDDLAIHLKAARALLRPGGRLAFTTPNAYTGPHDISWVLDLDAPAGMHLREYTYRHLTIALRESGFVDVASPLRVPAVVSGRLRVHPAPFLSSLYLQYLSALERPLGRLRGRRRKTAARALRVALFPSNIVLVASVPA